MSLYTLLYKEGQKAAASGFIEASSLQVAEKLGMEYCEKSSNRRYISVKEAVLMKETGLEVYPKGDMRNRDNDPGVPLTSLNDFEEGNQIKLDGKGVPHKLGRN